MNTKVALVSGRRRSWIDAGAMRAHHGDAGRYEEKLTTVTGTVAELQLINPHSMIVVDVTDSDGKIVRWRGEAGSATRDEGLVLVQRGHQAGRQSHHGGPPSQERLALHDAVGKRQE